MARATWNENDYKAAILVRVEAINARGSLVHPKPRRPGSTLQTFEPSLWVARCPDCGFLVARVREVRTDVTARAPFVHPDAPDSENDGASAELHIGTVVTLEPGFVNAPRRSSVVELPDRPTYHRSRRTTWTKPLRIRKPAIVICKRECRMFLDVPRGDPEFASATEEEREAMAFEAFERSDEIEIGGPVRQIMREQRALVGLGRRTAMDLITDNAKAVEPRVVETRLSGVLLSLPSEGAVDNVNVSQMSRGLYDLLFFEWSSQPLPDLTATNKATIEARLLADLGEMGVRDEHAARFANARR